MLGRRTKAEITRLGGEGLIRLSGPTASIIGSAAGVPVLGAGVSAVVGVGMLGHRAFGLVASRRVRNAIRAAAEEGDWTAYYREELKTGGAERLRRQLLELLRDLDDAVSDEAVEPLTILFGLRSRGEVEWEDARVAATLLRRASNGELKVLRTLFATALRHCEDTPLTFLRGHAVSDRRPVFLVWSHAGDQVELSEIPDNISVLRLLTASGAASAYVPSQSTASGDSGSSPEGIVIERETVTFLCTLLA